uniref:RxLR effector candidate protein n=1 Tax=Hyaloperonospora arabidopsidis (strain Emoy2) TaxID=559515 RepID=M4BL83_HYAAE
MTLPGLLVALVLGLILAIRQVASLLTYPGQIRLVIREGEASFARLTKHRLQAFTEAALELVAVLDPIASNRPTRLRFLQVHQNFTFALETMALPIMESLEILERDGQLGINGEKLLSALQQIVMLNSQRLSEPCSKLCSASEKTFELQRCELFNEKEAAEQVSMKLRTSSQASC